MTFLEADNTGPTTFHRTRPDDGRARQDQGRTVRQAESRDAVIMTMKMRPDLGGVLAFHRVGTCTADSNCPKNALLAHQHYVHNQYTTTNSIINLINPPVTDTSCICKNLLDSCGMLQVHA